MTKQQIEQLIDDNSIRLIDGDKITGHIGEFTADVDAVKAQIRDNKAAIMAILREREDYAKHQAAFEDACGYNKICTAFVAWNKYMDELESCMEDEGEAKFPVRPKMTQDDVLALYPVGAIYHTLRGWLDAANCEQRAAASKAIERLVNGDDPQTVYAEANAEWTHAAMRLVANA